MRVSGVSLPSGCSADWLDIKALTNKCAAGVNAFGREREGGGEDVRRKDEKNKKRGWYSRHQQRQERSSWGW
jgi:hypothetical protein